MVPASPSIIQVAKTDNFVEPSETYDVKKSRRNLHGHVEHEGPL